MKIISLLRSFLWNDSNLALSGAKISWDKICLPKEEGGLGDINLKV